MLWTDAYVVASCDMLQVEPEIADVAASESITIDGSTGIIEIVRQEATNKIMAEMQRFGGYLAAGLVSGSQLAAVLNVGGPGVNRTRILPGQIVVDPFEPVVKNWFLYQCLARFYRTVHARIETNGNRDRYKEKQDQYEQDIIRMYWPNLKNIGMPVVYRPMWAPGAPFERGTGTWDGSNVLQVTGTGTSGGTFQVAITYVDQTVGYINPTRKGNCESYHSAAQNIVVDAGNVIQISTAGLTPPNGSTNPANLSQTITTPLTATGWNVYVGAAQGPLYLQNASPIPTATGTYTLAGDPVLSGFQSDNGQYADNYFTMQSLIQRG